MSDICEREDHSLKSMNFGASGKDCPYCRIVELEHQNDQAAILLIDAHDKSLAAAKELLNAATRIAELEARLEAVKRLPKMRADFLAPWYGKDLMVAEDVFKALGGDDAA